MLQYDILNTKGYRMKLTRSALLARMRRGLKADAKKMIVSKCKDDFGQVHIIDLNTNSVIHTYPTLTDAATQMGVIHPWEDYQG